MGKRGRKKGGIDVNLLSDEQEIINMIINQANSLNKKIKAFSKEGITEHQNYVNSMLGNGLVKFNKTGSISKSRKFFEKQHILFLRKTLHTLVKLNNHDTYGTVKKYRETMTIHREQLENYVDDYLRGKGYSIEFIDGVTKTNGFYENLVDAFNSIASGYTSNQVIEKVALQYGEQTGFNKKEVQKIYSNIEYSKNKLDKLKEEQEMKEKFIEYMRNNGLR